MNKIDFGDYIEHFLRKIMDGNTVYRSILTNHIVLPQKEIKTKVA